MQRVRRSRTRARGLGLRRGQIGGANEHRGVLVDDFRRTDLGPDHQQGGVAQLNLIARLQHRGADLLPVDQHAVGRGEVLHLQHVALEKEFGMAARQLGIAEAELALHRAAEGHGAGDVILVPLVLALHHLQQPARCRGHLGADLGRIDDLQLERAQPEAVAGADLVALADLLVVDIGAAGSPQVGEVVEAVFQQQFGMERFYPGIAHDQFVAAVGAEGETFIGQPDGALAIVNEMNPEHV